MTESDESKYLALLRQLRQTIALMPMKHLGQSVFKGLYGIVKQPELARVAKPQPGELTPGWVVRNFGDYELRRDYHDAFQKIGGLLLDTDASLYHWAEFTARVQKDPFSPEAFQKIFQTLTKTYEEDCQVSDYREAQEPRPRVDKPTDGHFGRAVSNKLDLSQLKLRQAICTFSLGSPDKKLGI